MNRVFRVLIGVTCCVLVEACTAQQQSQTQQSADLARIATEVHTKLALIDPDSTTAVKVTASHDGTVTLSGAARNAKQKAAYDSVAASVSGVRRVDDRLQINPGLRGPSEQFADVALGAKVAANIAAQAGVNAARVKPEVHDGVVTLSGSVSSPSIKSTMLEAARNTSGVKRVIDRIEVKP